MRSEKGIITKKTAKPILVVAGLLVKHWRDQKTCCKADLLFFSHAELEIDQCERHKKLHIRMSTICECFLQSLAMMVDFSKPKSRNVGPQGDCTRFQWTCRFCPVCSSQGGQVQQPSVSPSTQICGPNRKHWQHSKHVCTKYSETEGSDLYPDL